MITLKKIAAACLIAAFLLPATSFAGHDKDKKEKKDNGKHKGWYKNPNNPHHPDHVSKHKKKKHKDDDDKAEKDDKYEAPKEIIVTTPKGSKCDPKPVETPKEIIITAPKGTKDDPKPTGPVIGTKPGVGKG